MLSKRTTCRAQLFASRYRANITAALARRATERLPAPMPGQKRGHAIGRDLVSHYVRGAMLPDGCRLVLTDVL